MRDNCRDYFVKDASLSLCPRNGWGPLLILDDRNIKNIQGKYVIMRFMFQLDLLVYDLLPRCETGGDDRDKNPGGNRDPNRDENPGGNCDPNRDENRGENRGENRFLRSYFSSSLSSYS